MEQDNVTLARRASGGGAVYQVESLVYVWAYHSNQDLGNTCFTFLSPLNTYDRNRNSLIICRALEKFGIAAAPSGRNDIEVDGLKISGSAFRIQGMKAFHHGTLLINVDLGALANYLNVNKAKLQVHHLHRDVLNHR